MKVSTRLADGPCKHIWGTILAAEARGYLSSAASAPELVLQEDGEEVDFESDVLEELPLLPSAPREIPKAPAPPPAWKKDLAAVANLGSQSSSEAGHGPPKNEAARFTPRLRVLDYIGLARNAEEFNFYEAILTTYGTIRRDALRLEDFEFDYVVLDEAQAIKNAATESAKAVRLLRARHRLALSGTPVENHLGELFSLFGFLNPGMLAAASVLKLAGAAGRNPDEETRRLLAHALRPFILRRTKEQVARELPSTTEQTNYCEMEPAQRKLYDELRQHYRNTLLGRIEKEGLAKSKIQVLEALLRLRQAACHRGLIDSKRSVEESAKLDMLRHKLREVVDEGHKALVFHNSRVC